MNRLKKTTFAVLGIASAVGLASLIGPSMRWYRVARENMQGQSKPSICPTPAPTKLFAEDQWFWTVQCKHCGEEYKRPRACTFVPTDEEMEHLHTTPEQRARAIKLFDELLKESENVSAPLKQTEVQTMPRAVRSVGLKRGR
jgi:hypothetical protein